MLLAQNVSKSYQLYSKPADRLTGALGFGFNKPTEFWALRDVSFSVERGEILSLIGPNGCGKSTLLQIVSGILKPSTGRVVTEGRVAALLELGAGFNPEFSGRENVILNGEILGLTRDQILEAMPSIEGFADIGRFFDRPVKEYSTGMYVRLGFSTAIHVYPEILIVDEVLAVGDAIFANRCIRKFEELRARKTTILFVSHDLGLVKQLSHRALLLVNGRVTASGLPNDVVNRYVGLVLDREQKRTDPANLKLLADATHRHGDGTSEVLSALLLNDQQQQVCSVQTGERVTLHIQIAFRSASLEPKVGMMIRTKIGTEVFGTNTKIEDISLGRFHAGSSLTIKFSFCAELTPQDYTITIATQNDDGSSHDWLDDVLTFEVISGHQRAGIADLNPSVSWSAQHPSETNTIQE